MPLYHEDVCPPLFYLFSLLDSYRDFFIARDYLISAYVSNHTVLLKKSLSLSKVILFDQLPRCYPQEETFSCLIFPLNCLSTNH